MASLGTSEIFSLRTQTWREGPMLPTDFDLCAAAQLDETFLIVGGVDVDSYQMDSIIEFDQINYEWIFRSQKLSTPRITPGAIALPRGFVQC